MQIFDQLLIQFCSIPSKIFVNFAGICLKFEALKPKNFRLDHFIVYNDCEVLIPVREEILVGFSFHFIVEFVENEHSTYNI